MKQAPHGIKLYVPFVIFAAMHTFLLSTICLLTLQTTTVTSQLNENEANEINNEQQYVRMIQDDDKSQPFLFNVLQNVSTNTQHVSINRPISQRFLNQTIEAMTELLHQLQVTCSKILPHHGKFYLYNTKSEDEPTYKPCKNPLHNAPVVNDITQWTQLIQHMVSHNVNITQSPYFTTDNGPDYMSIQIIAWKTQERSFPIIPIKPTIFQTFKPSQATRPIYYKLYHITNHRIRVLPFEPVYADFIVRLIVAGDPDFTKPSLTMCHNPDPAQDTHMVNATFQRLINACELTVSHKRAVYSQLLFHFPSVYPIIINNTFPEISAPVSQSNPVVLPPYKPRQKRALFDPFRFLRHLIHKAFCPPDVTAQKSAQYTYTRLKNVEQYISKINLHSNQMQDSLVEIANEINTVRMELFKSTDMIFKVMEINRFTQLFDHLYTLFQDSITHFNTIITLTQQQITPPMLLDQNLLSKASAQIQMKLGKTINTNINEIKYELHIDQSHTVLTIIFPLKQTATQHLIHIIPYPEFNDGQKYTPALNRNYFVTRPQTHTYAMLSDQEATQCMIAPDLCYFAHPMMNVTVDAECSIKAYFTNYTRCPFYKANENSPFFFVQKFTVYYAMPQALEAGLFITCRTVYLAGKKQVVNKL